MSSYSISPYSNLSSLQYPKIKDCVSFKDKLWMGIYQVRKEIGEGQYGKVFLARDVFKPKEAIHRRVAIKVLNSTEEDSDSDSEHKIFECMQKK